MDLREIGWEGMDWIHMTEDRDQWRALVNTVMNLVTNSMEQCLSCGTNNHSASQIPRLLWNQKFYYRVYKSPPLVPI
jgi:hypothetical protein